MAPYWNCDAKTVVQHVSGISIEAVEPYLRRWTEAVSDSRMKAYPDDECCYGANYHAQKQIWKPILIELAKLASADIVHSAS